MTIPVFIGYDERQPIAYTALCQSIIDNCTLPVAITPLVLRTLPITRQGLTPFTYSRFLVPWLCKFEGWAIFADIDMMVRGDLAELWAQCDDAYAVMASKNVMKFERASLMLFNCGKCSMLTPEYVKSADGMHGLGFVPDEQIGDLPREWNHLVGYDAPKANVKLAHYTQGIPLFPETKTAEYATEWREYATKAMGSVPWITLMGNSVHAKPVMDRLNRNAA